MGGFRSVAGVWILAAPEGAAEEYGIAPVKVGAGPFSYDTAEQHDIQVELLARGLAHAYSLAFLPNADALVVERGTRLRRVRDPTGKKPVLVAEPVAGTPNYANTEHAGPDDVLGIQDIALHPDFVHNHLIYYTFNRPAGFDPAAKRLHVATVLARARLEGSELLGAQDLVVGEVVQDVGGSRILFGQGNLVYVSVGAISSGDVNSSQRTNNIYGKVLRVRDDGSIPDDNPFVAVPGARREIYSLGHRDPLGLTLEAHSGSVIASEHGPQGGDKINRIVAGRNYAPSGITFYGAERFPAWKNNLFVASARRGEIDRTGALLRVVFNDKLQEIRQESLLESLHQRMRDVRQGPDGLLYVLTDEDDSALLRISPVVGPARRCRAP